MGGRQGKSATDRAGLLAALGSHLGVMALVAAGLALAGSVLLLSRHSHAA